MKTHAIIPIFVPHAGCPHDCVFCNQKAITARSGAPEQQEIINTIERNLSTIKTNPNISTVEIAFFGGSFTGIPEEEQHRYLKIAKSYKDNGLIHNIRLSTRPDYININILNNLKNYNVDIIELGVQSFDPDVLRKSNRGHDTQTVFKNADLIKSYGFTLGIQLMIGLPGDSYEKCMDSVAQTIKIAPQIARIYPTVVIRDTALYEMTKNGKYTPVTEREAVITAKDMYLSLTNAGINVIRIGLKSSDNIKMPVQQNLNTEQKIHSDGINDTDTSQTGYAEQQKHASAHTNNINAEQTGEIGAGDYHPAFRQLVESEIAKDQLKAALPDSLPAGTKVTFKCNPASFSNMIGNKRSNKIYFAEKYPHLKIKFATDKNLPEKIYIVNLPENTADN
ncbi:MAG: radical SAM protein [Firmicutes bacterium]|nr:radical SAM protein [Bacillota bacterium]